jgi:hypothetical protein
MALDDVYRYFRDWDRESFEVVACQGNEPTESEVAEFEAAVGFRLPDEFREFTMSPLGGLYMAVREELWPRPRVPGRSGLVLRVWPEGLRNRGRHTGLARYPRAVSRDVGLGIRGAGAVPANRGRCRPVLLQSSRANRDLVPRRARRARGVGIQFLGYPVIRDSGVGDPPRSQDSWRGPEQGLTKHSSGSSCGGPLNSGIGIE